MAVWRLGREFVLSGNVPERYGPTVGCVDRVQSAPGRAPAGTARRFRAMSPMLAWVLGGAVLVLAVAAVALDALIGQLSIGIPAGTQTVSSTVVNAMA